MSTTRTRSFALAAAFVAAGGPIAASRPDFRSGQRVEQCRLTENDTLLEVVTHGGSCNFYLGTTFKIDIDVTVTARQLAGPDNFGYGLMFGRTSLGADGAASFYQFVVTANGFYRLRFWDGSRDITIIDWTRHPAIKTGVASTNALRVVTQKDIIRCFVNGAYVGGARAGNGLIGGVGYVVEEFGMRAKFEGLTGRELGKSVEAMPMPGAVLFADDLLARKTFQVGGLLVCRASYDADGYVVENVSPLNGLCDLPLIAAGTFGSNIQIEITTKLRRGPMDHSFGAYFGRAGPLARPMYIGVIDGQGTFQITQRTTAWQRLTRLLVHDGIRKGLEVWNRLSIEIRGQTIRGYVNGELTAEAAAPAVVEGQIGLYVDAPGMIAVFRDLRVTQN